MDRESLLTKEDIEKLENWSDGYFYKIFYYLEDFIAKGINENRFTLEQAKEDLNIALWYAYAGNNIDVYEYYYKVIKWMPFSEKNANACGAWFYRYSVALLYCSKIDEAYFYAKKGVEEDPQYPWGWLNLAKLHYYFGQKSEALNAIEKGANLVEDKHEFITLREEIERACSLEQMLYHYINDEDDKNISNADNQSEMAEKLQAIAGVICDEDNLNEIKQALKIKSWRENMPYCSGDISFADDVVVKCIFSMNRASVSKLKLTWISSMYENIKSRLFVKRYGVQYRLAQMEISRTLEIKLMYYDQETGRTLLDYHIEDTLMNVSSNEQMGNIALTLLKQSDPLEYIECWLEENKIVKHFGQVGDKGNLKVYENCSAEDYKLYLDIFIGRYEKLGFVSWKDFPKQSVVLSLEVQPDKTLFKDDSKAPVYFIYEMMQKLLEINVIGFFNDWGFKEFKDNEENKSYTVDFYFDTVDKDLFMRLLKASLKVFDTNSIVKIKALDLID